MVQQKAPTESSGESQDQTEKKQMEEQLSNLSEQNKQLIVENYVNSLGDKKTFRLELLQMLTKINQSLESLNETILDGLSQTSEEESPEEIATEETKEEVPTEDSVE